MSGQRSYEQLLAEAVGVLTEAARATTSWTDRDGRERCERTDFAEFIAHVLAAAAANLGGIEQLLAGRPGSWEAGHVRQLLTGTVGDDEKYLLEHRSEPLIVTVEVDELLSELGCWQLYEQAEDELQRREDATGCPTVTGVPGTAEFETACAQLPAPTGEQQQALEEIAELRERLERLRVADWTAYGQAFRANVLTAAGQLYPRLPVPVLVEVHLDWHDNTHSLDDDWSLGGPGERLWQHAYQHTPLPGSGIPPTDYPPGSDIAQVERDAGRDPLARLRHRGSVR